MLLKITKNDKKLPIHTKKLRYIYSMNSISYPYCIHIQILLRFDKGSKHELLLTELNFSTVVWNMATRKINLSTRNHKITIKTFLSFITCWMTCRMI